MSKIKKVIYGVVGVSVLTAIALPVFAGSGHYDGHDGHGMRSGHEMRSEHGHGHGHGMRSEHGHGHGMRSEHGRGIRNDGMPSKIFQNLGLDEAQRNAFIDAANESKREWTAVSEQIRESRKIMQDMDPKADDYDVKVVELAKRHAELASQMTILMAGMKSTMADLLTDAQWQEIIKLEKRYQ